MPRRIINGACRPRVGLFLRSQICLKLAQSKLVGRAVLCPPRTWCDVLIGEKRRARSDAPYQFTSVHFADETHEGTFVFFDARIATDLGIDEVIVIHIIVGRGNLADDALFRSAPESVIDSRS